MDSFAFIVHPIDPKKDVSRKFPFLGRILSAELINFFSTFFPPVFLSEIEGITSQSNGKQIKGWLLACPLTAVQMLRLPKQLVYRKIIQTGRLAERLGAKILGLGAYTSVVGDGGVTVAENLDIPVTSGDAYTVAVAVESLTQAAIKIGISLSDAKAAVIGATGAIGWASSGMLARQVAELILIGRNQDRLAELRKTLIDAGVNAKIHISTSMGALSEAQLIMSATSAPYAIVHPEHLLPGSIICDVAMPRDVSRKVAQERDDVLVIDGGIVEVPGPVDFHFDFGLSTGEAYACMAETMALTLEGRFEDYSLGRHISRSRVLEIASIAQRHGFRLGSLKSFEQAITREHVARVRHLAYQRL